MPVGATERQVVMKTFNLPRKQSSVPPYVACPYRVSARVMVFRRRFEGGFQSGLAVGIGEGKMMESRDSGPNVQAFLFPSEISVISPKKSFENPCSTLRLLYTSWRGKCKWYLGVVWAGSGYLNRRGKRKGESSFRMTPVNSDNLHIAPRLSTAP
jgi:hypothetical protein